MYNLKECPSIREYSNLDVNIFRLLRNYTWKSEMSLMFKNNTMP